jgi:stage II sporulation protein AA (anti-sigma F factor antagonist)
MPDGARSGPDRGFTLRARVRDRSLEVALGGELDMAAVFKLEPAVEQLLATDDVRALVLDLADVSSVDSAGLGAILAIRERTLQASIGIAITRPSDPVRRLLDLTGNGELLGG